MAGLLPLDPRTRTLKGPELAPLTLHGLQASFVPTFPLVGPREHGSSKKASLPPDAKDSQGDRPTAEGH